MSILLSPLMNLPIPGVGSEAGPQYALDVNNSFTILDGHTHAPGSGSQITPNGLNINSSLSFNNNFAVSLAGLTLSPQISTPNVNTIYESGVDLYYVDGLGNNIQITASGAVAGTPGSIANLVAPASATYVDASKTFVWQSDVSTAANLDAGSLLLRNISPNSTNAVTLSPPSNLSSNYTLTLPALPSSAKIMTLDNAGNMAAPYVVDNSTIQIQANTILVPTAGITATQIASSAVTTPKIADANVTRPKLAPLGQAVSSGVVSYTTLAPSVYTIIPGCSLSITTTGRPVQLSLQPFNPAGQAAYISTTSGAVFLAFYRDGSLITQQKLFITTEVPVTSFSFVDVNATAGTHTYDVYQVSTGSNWEMSNCLLMAYEIG